MSIQRLGCPCGGNPECKLCAGDGFYRYEAGPRGWMPFTCPTCEGKGVLETSGSPPRECPTCHRAGSIDPANPPMTMLTKIRKMFFGG